LPQGSKDIDFSSKSLEKEMIHSLAIITVHHKSISSKIDFLSSHFSQALEDFKPIFFRNINQQAWLMGIYLLNKFILFSKQFSDDI
jgi:hypothetical protein